MIIGIGIDIVDIKRIEKIIDKYGKKFIFRCFSKNEIQRAERNFNPANSYAKRYAAKEACAKALGTGLARDIFWKDILVGVQKFLFFTDKLDEGEHATENRYDNKSSCLRTHESCKRVWGRPGNRFATEV